MSGRVEVYSTMPFAASCLTLYLHGYEQTHFWTRHRHQEEQLEFLGTHPIIENTWTIMNLAQYDGVILPGSYSFPFKLLLPEWLPQSAAYAHNSHSLNIGVKYYLRA